MIPLALCGACCAPPERGGTAAAKPDADIVRRVEQAAPTTESARPFGAVVSYLRRRPTDERVAYCRAKAERLRTSAKWAESAEEFGSLARELADQGEYEVLSTLAGTEGAPRRALCRRAIRNRCRQDPRAVGWLRACYAAAPDRGTLACALDCAAVSECWPALLAAALDRGLDPEQRWSAVVLLCSYADDAHVSRLEPVTHESVRFFPAFASPAEGRDLGSEVAANIARRKKDGERGR